MTARVVVAGSAVWVAAETRTGSAADEPVLTVARAARQESQSSSRTSSKSRI